MCEGMDGQREEQDQRLDELTSELRVIIPGVTVLFAFLITVPFAAGFGGLSPGSPSRRRHRVRTGRTPARAGAAWRDRRACPAGERGPGR